MDKNFFGQPARQAVEDVISSGPPRDAELIFKLTEAEIEKQYCSKLLTATEINKKFGVGQWRPLHRFVIHQAGDKARLIDDGSRGGQNSWASLHETIYTINVDFVPAVAAALAREAAGLAEDQQDEAWADCQLSTTDLPDAFRGLPIAPAHQRAAVVAIWHPAR